MLPLLRRFCRDERGAVSAEFVTITAAVVGLGVAIFLILSQAAEPTSENLGQWLADLDFGL